ncbi:zinc-binding dehydrogenase family [Colletotrichum tofieldiae]|uniref:Zinc-binding dehydrogenase family n=1 Tax=Colletotrichum tofieldiae TaxID=708197 RepID=A0A166PBP4_9PEZI|nr:zinc-binding dehydrogenase family [Colletotrichum tofieldiae]GKT82136.1 zinc-binding dehydrogenase family [Colletotrichum tofieldiae]
MSPPATQTAIVQTAKGTSTELPLAVNRSAPVPKPPSEHHLLVRVLAVALNPNDHKMVTHFDMPNNTAGCDFCGVVEEAGHSKSSFAARFPLGTRVCGALFAYNPDAPDNGAFSQWIVVDSRLLVKVPDSWTDLEAASLGVGWSTLCLAFSDPDALGLEGLPSKPLHQAKEPVLVYGGGTASATLACQLLSLMGYTPIAITSARSAALAVEYGAVGTASYTSKDCVDVVKSLAKKPIRYVLDCITDAESVAICYSAIARTGGNYACLEECPEVWRTRRAVKLKEVMGFQVLGVDINLGTSTYTRLADEKLMKIGMQWAGEIQLLMETGRIKAHPLRELENGWEGIIHGLELLRKGEVRGEKLVARIP